MRHFIFTVENGFGDTAEVPVSVRDDRSPACYKGPAILKAKRVIPDEKPFRVIALQET